MSIFEMLLLWILGVVAGIFLGFWFGLKNGEGEDG